MVNDDVDGVIDYMNRQHPGVDSNHETLFDLEKTHIIYYNKLRTTLLGLSIMFGAKKVINMLCSYNTNSALHGSAESDCDYSILDLACYVGNVEVVRYAINGKSKPTLQTFIICTLTHRNDIFEYLYNHYFGRISVRLDEFLSTILVAAECANNYHVREIIFHELSNEDNKTLFDNVIRGTKTYNNLRVFLFCYTIYDDYMVYDYIHDEFPHFASIIENKISNTEEIISLTISNKALNICRRFKKDEMVKLLDSQLTQSLHIARLFDDPEIFEKIAIPLEIGIRPSNIKFVGEFYEHLCNLGVDHVYNGNPGEYAIAAIHKYGKLFAKYGLPFDDNIDVNEYEEIFKRHRWGPDIEIKVEEEEEDAVDEDRDEVDEDDITDIDIEKKYEMERKARNEEFERRMKGDEDLNDAIMNGDITTADRLLSEGKRPSFYCLQNLDRYIKTAYDNGNQITDDVNEDIEVWKEILDTYGINIYDGTLMRGGGSDVCKLLLMIAFVSLIIILIVVIIKHVSSSPLETYVMKGLNGIKNNK